MTLVTEISVYQLKLDLTTAGYTFKFSKKDGKRYLSVNLKGFVPQTDKILVKQIVNRWFKDAYVTSFSSNKVSFRLNPGYRKSITQKQLNFDKRGLTEKLGEVLLRADCKTRLATISQYDWMAQHAIEYLQSNGYLK